MKSFITLLFVGMSLALTAQQVTVEIAGEPWTDGYNGKVIISPDADIADWSMTLNVDGTVTHAWNADWSFENGKLTLDALGYNSVVDSGGMYDQIGFSVTGSNLSAPEVDGFVFSQRATNGGGTIRSSLWELDEATGHIFPVEEVIGNVGIGTNAPQAPLEIVSDVNPGGVTNLLQLRSASDAVGTTTALRFLNSPGGSKLGGMEIVNRLSGDDQGNLEFNHWNSNSWSRLMQVSRDGVGIGTGSNALYDLNVGDNARIPTLLTDKLVNLTPSQPILMERGGLGSISHLLQLKNPSYARGSGTQLSMRVGPNAFGESISGVIRTEVAVPGEEEGRMSFFITSSAELKKRLVLGPDGVGVNCDDQFSYALAVNGKVLAKEVRVETGWSDFVFEDDYELKSLEEVKAFIDDHGHLPDVPNAETVESEGIEIGASQANLLQKIEELTLYVIDLNEQMKAQKTEIEALKEENQSLKSTLINE